MPVDLEDYILKNDQKVKDAVIGNSNGEGTIEAFGRSLAYAVAQAPALGVAQFVDNCAQTNLAKHVKFMDAPKPAEFNSAEWYAQQVGLTAGALPWLVGLMHGADKVLPGARGTVQRNIGMAATAGFTHEFFMTPSQQSDQFFVDRLKHGVTGAATFASVTALHAGLTRIPSIAEGSLKTGFQGRLARASLSGASGVGGAFVGTEMQSLLEHGHHADNTELARSMYANALLGTAIAGIFGGRPTRRTVAETEQKATTSGEPVSAEQRAQQLQVRPAVEQREGAAVPQKTAAAVETKAPVQSTTPVESPAVAQTRAKPDSIRYKEGTPGGRAWRESYKEIPENERDPMSDLVPDEKLHRLEAVGAKNKVVGNIIYSDIGNIHSGNVPLVGAWYLTVLNQLQSLRIGRGLLGAAIDKVYGADPRTVVAGEIEHTGMDLRKMPHLPSEKSMRTAIKTGELERVGPLSESVVPETNQPLRRIRFYVDQAKDTGHEPMFVRGDWLMPDPKAPLDASKAGAGHIMYFRENGKPLSLKQVQQMQARMLADEYGYGLGWRHPLVQRIMDMPLTQENFGTVRVHPMDNVRNLGGEAVSAGATAQPSAVTEAALAAATRDKH